MSLPSQLSDTIPAIHELHLFTFESIAQFAKILKWCNECLCFMVTFAYRVAHGGDKVAEVNHCSEQMLSELEKDYLAVFSEPLYSIWEH